MCHHVITHWIIPFLLFLCLPQAGIARQARSTLNFLMPYSVGRSGPLARSQQMRRQPAIGVREAEYQPNASGISEQRACSTTVQPAREAAD